MASSKSPCAACKTLRRKCIEQCVFAPYFPPDKPHRFETVHKVYGASNVAKILTDLPAAERVDAVSTLVYEAEARLKDPVYGCVGSISILQRKLKQIQTQIQSAKQELATYIGFVPQSSAVPVIGSREQDILRNLEQHCQQQQMQHQQPSMDISRSNSRVGPSGQQSYVQHIHGQNRYRQQLMDQLRFNRRLDGAGPSGHATGPYGPIDSNVCHIQQQPQPQQQQDHHLQQVMQLQSANDHSSCI
ncbi:hypothetical protein R6Q57_002722 [Mikania cordata]